MPIGTKKPIPTALFFNCGFARVSVQQSSSENPTTSQNEFRSQFSDHPEYDLADEYFRNRGKNSSKFEYARQAIVKTFTKKWYPHEDKQLYITNFSKASWKALSTTDKKKHTFSFCEECREKYGHLQRAFPTKPIFSQPNATCTTVTLAHPAIGSDERRLTNDVLRDLNGTYDQSFGHTFVDALVKNCGEVKLRKRATEIIVTR